MDTTDPTGPTADKLVTLAFFDREIEATMLADELQNHGIAAQAAGTLTAGFRAEAPGSVKVLVHERDLQRAEQIMKESIASRGDIDWDQIDVGEMED